MKSSTPLAVVFASFSLLMLLLAPTPANADCACVPLNFNYPGNGAGAYEGPPTTTFSEGCSHVFAQIEADFQAYAAGTCGTLGLFGGLCQVTRTVTIPCFNAGGGYFFGGASYNFRCLSCGF